MISGGTLTISKSYEGIEGTSIAVTGGVITLTASDDGFNAAGGNDMSSMGGRPGMNSFEVSSDSYIKISGGIININASGDGVDSNGNLYVSGGATFVSGPTDSGNGALDYAASAEITGGIFIAAGSSGMAQNFGSTSTQGSALVAFNGSIQGGSVITLENSSGRALLTFTAAKQFNCVVVSTPDMVQGETYTLTAGSSSQSFTLRSLIYGSGSGMGGFGGGGKRR